MMEKCIPTGANNTQMAPKMVPNVPLEASKWARRPQDDSRGARMVSMKLQEPLKDSQGGPKMAHMAPNMTPRQTKMAPKGPKVRWPQEDSRGTN